MRCALWLAMLAGCGRLGFAREAPDAAPDAPRVISFVQATTNEVMDGSAEVSAPFTGDVVAGDLIVIALDYSFPSTVTSTVADTLGTAYAVAVASDAQDGYAQIMFAGIASGGPDTITAMLSGPSQNFIELRVFEYRGITTLDVGSIRTEVPTADGPIAGTPIVTTGSDELVIGFAVGHPGIITAGQGFTLRSLFDGDVVEDQPAPTPGSYQVTAGFSSGDLWTISTAAFR